MNYRARDTTQSDFWAHYGALCQQTDEISRAMAESNINASNSISRINASMAQCCCNFEETRMRIEEQTVEHYVPGLNSPFVTRQSVVQFINDDLRKRVNDLMLQNMQAYAYGAYGLGEANREPQKTMQEELSQCKTHEEMLQIARKHGCAIDLTNPEKKYTVYDLYDLVFPDDPIKAHFDAERKRIIEEYEQEKSIYEKMEIKPVNHVEIVQKQTGKPKINQEALQAWVEFEKYVSITFAAGYVFWVFVGIMLAFPVSVENGTRFLVDVTRIHSALFLAASSVSLAVAVFASRSKEND